MAFSSIEVELQTSGAEYILFMLHEPSAEKPAAIKQEEPFDGNPLKVQDEGLMKGAVNVWLPPQLPKTVNVPAEGALLKTTEPETEYELSALSQTEGDAVRETNEQEYPHAVVPAPAVCS